MCKYLEDVWLRYFLDKIIQMIQLVKYDIYRVFLMY